MRYSTLITLVALFAFYTSSHAEDPRSYDLCVIVTKGKTEVVKNKKGLDVDGLIELHQITQEGDFVLLARDGQTHVISIRNGNIFYMFRILGSHCVFYKISVKEFAAYVSGNEEWNFPPINYTDLKSGKILMQVPSDEMKNAPNQTPLCPTNNPNGNTKNGGSDGAK